MTYFRAVLQTDVAFLSRLSDADLYDEANSFYNLEHGVGFYSRETLIQMILQYKYKVCA